MTDSFQNIAVTTLPDITEIKFINIDKNYKKVILISFLLIFTPLLTGLFLLDQFVFPEEIKENMVFIYSGFVVLFIYGLLHLLLGLPKRKYALREKDISYKSGLFVKKTTTVPFSRIQHVETDEKPISRLFGLASLSVYTAGDSSDDLEINGITIETALQIKEFISIKINE